MFKCLNNIRKRKGQSTLEYAVLIVVIIAALLAMNSYIKRGIQGRLKSSTDDIGDQFSPGNTNYIKNTVVHGHTKETFKEGVQTSNMLDKESTNIFEEGNIIHIDQEFYGTN